MRGDERHGFRRIFLSYRRDDTRGVAGRLFDRLAKRFGDANVFIDVVAIEPGRDFGEAIERAVGGCDVLLALIGRTWLSGTDEHGQRRIDDPTDLVRLEIKSALDRDIKVIPVLVDGAVAPRLVDLPEDLAPLARLNAVRLDHATFDADMGPLMKVLDGAVRQPSWLRWLRRLAVAAAVVMLAVVLWFLIPWLLSPPTPETRTAMPVVTKTTDPCSFVSTDDLAEFGRVLLTPEYGYFAGCTATIQAGGETPVDVRIELDVPQHSGQPFPGTVETRGQLVIAREQCVDECRTTLQMADGPRVVLQVRDGDASLRQKVAGRATETATRVLEAGPLSERPPFPEHSMGRVMACDLLTADEISSRVDVPVKATPGFGHWTCAWGRLPTTVIGIGYDRTTPNEIRDEGSEQIAARKVYVVSRIRPDNRPACQVNIPGIGFTSRTDEPRVEVVQLLVHGADSRAVEQMCSYARALAEVVVPGLPR